MVRVMKVYIDVVFALNFFFDLILLFGVKNLLKRKGSNIRLLFGALLGEASCITLFLPLSTLSLILVKLLISTLMILITFGYGGFNSFKKNLLYFYLLSVTLGGIIYVLKLSFRVNSTDFFTNFLILIMIGPYFLWKYISEHKIFKSNYSLRHDVEIYYKQRKYDYVAYLDTGNKLQDPYKKRPIILVYDKRLNFSYEDSILVPYKTLNNEGVLKCQKVEKIIIDKKIQLTDILIGKAHSNFNIEGVDVILPNIIKEEL